MRGTTGILPTLRICTFWSVLTVNRTNFAGVKARKNNFGIFAIFASLTFDLYRAKNVGRYGTFSSLPEASRTILWAYGQTDPQRDALQTNTRPSVVTVDG